MKIKVLMAALFGLITVTAFAQKGELSNAQSEYSKNMNTWYVKGQILCLPNQA